VVGLPITVDRDRPRPARSAPKLGEHTDEVLGTLQA
jgi:crotonobetainyl-CoA:carnitine CoA-transferase CaiB-like acyl-CoA transferase